VACVHFAEGLGFLEDPREVGEQLRDNFDLPSLPLRGLLAAVLVGTRRRCVVEIHNVGRIRRGLRLLLGSKIFVRYLGGWLIVPMLHQSILAEEGRETRLCECSPAVEQDVGESGNVLRHFLSLMGYGGTWLQRV
jgi:hypothetical protein